MIVFLLGLIALYTIYIMFVIFAICVILIIKKAVVLCNSYSYSTVAMYFFSPDTKIVTISIDIWKEISSSSNNNIKDRTSGGRPAFNSNRITSTCTNKAKSWINVYCSWYPIVYVLCC